MGPSFYGSRTAWAASWLPACDIRKRTGTSVLVPVRENLIHLKELVAEVVSASNAVACVGMRS